MSLFKEFSQLLPYLQSVRKLEKYLSFDVQFPKTWKILKKYVNEEKVLQQESKNTEERLFSFISEINEDDVNLTIDNIKNSGSRYLLTTSFTKFCENTDINDGEWREINLMIHPFNLKPIYLINEMCFESYPLATDKCMLLFDLKDLCNCKHENR